MSFRSLLFIAIAVCCFGCKKREKLTLAGPAGPGTTGSDSVNVQHISVLTQHNDNTRAGLNNKEAALTTANVRPGGFGMQFLMNADDDIYAQPLIVGNLHIGKGVHNVAFIATVNNTVYAYDADKQGSPLWRVNFTEKGMNPPNTVQLQSIVWWCNPYTDFKYNIGIVGTPVIDSAAQTMYFVARSQDGAKFYQYLHAVNITDGSERPGSPVQIQASVPGTGDGSRNGIVYFDPKLNNQRQGLVLVNGVVYISYSSHCDLNPYHGWILGYDAHTLQQRYVYNDTPTGENGGIWECGMGIAADDQGNLYVTTGNGTVGQGNLFLESSNGTFENTSNPNPTDLTNRGESALKLTPSGNTLAIASYFTPTNYLDLNINDLDYGVMGTLLIPNSNYYFTGCKDGNLYLLDKDNMGGYSPTGNQNKQTIPFTATMRCHPAYYRGSTNEFVYLWPENEPLHAFAFNRSAGSLSYGAIYKAQTGPQNFGGVISVSSNGTKDGTGIVWAAYGENESPNAAYYPAYFGVLRAFDANDITKELWNSDMRRQDAPGVWAKYCSPTIANGKVYLATFSGQVVVYGLIK